MKEQKAVASHGTHVAGIIAANWDGKGVSGIAHGVKIFSVNVFGGNGNIMEISSVLKGFRFLADIAQEVNLKAVNCSWGTVQPQFCLGAAIEELGKKGVNTVISSGNRYLDLDESIDLGSQSRSEYAIVVNASSADGNMTDFSCWGQDSTDVFAPGGSILSSVPGIVQVGEHPNPDVYENRTRFFPEASDEASLLSVIGQADAAADGTGQADAAADETAPKTGIERFDSDAAGVLFFDANPALHPDARRIGEINEQNGYDDKRAMALRLSALPKEEESTYGRFRAVNGYAYMAIPVTSAKDARWISVKIAMTDAYKPAGGIDSITCADADGNPVELDSACAGALKKGLGSGAFYTFYQCQWSALSFNIKGYIDASNEAHERLTREMSEEERRELSYSGFGGYRDPGVIEGIYEWEHDGRKYVIARIGIGVLTGDAKQKEVTEETAVLVDNAAVGNENAFAGAYEVMSGTSMAAPAVTGCLAVIAANEPENASMTAEELENAARERAAKLLACVDYDDTLATLCRTGGRVNLHEKTEFTVKAPLISKVEVQQAAAQAGQPGSQQAGQPGGQQTVQPGGPAATQDGQQAAAQIDERGRLHVSGWYFGTKGTIAVDDKEVEAFSWEDGQIEADVSGIPNGSHVVKVTNADGAVSRAVFSLSLEAAQGRRLFEGTHGLPLREEAFIASECDRIYDSIAACGGKIYAFANSAKNRSLQGIWCYDIEADKWSPCALPEGLDYSVGCNANQLAVLGDTLYLSGMASEQGEDGSKVQKDYLWRFVPGENLWEKTEVEMPTGTSGICVLGDMLFAIGGNYWTEEELAESAEEGETSEESEIAAEDENAAAGDEAGESAAEDEDDAASDDLGESAAGKMNFYVIDPEADKGVEVSSDIDSSFDPGYGKITASGNKMYLYLPFGYGSSAEDQKNVTTKGKLFRASYDKAQNLFVTEDLTEQLEKALGPDLRSAFEKQSAGDEPAEHFAITGLENGLAIIGSGTPGEDVHIIYDDGQEPVLYDRASSYHKAVDPLAVYYDGRLYVIGNNTTEPEVMYFRSEQVRDMRQSAASGSVDGTGSANAGGASGGAAGTGGANAEGVSGGANGAVGGQGEGNTARSESSSQFIIFPQKTPASAGGEMNASC